MFPCRVEDVKIEEMKFIKCFHGSSYLFLIEEFDALKSEFVTTRNLTHFLIGDVKGHFNLKNIEKGHY